MKKIWLKRLFIIAVFAAAYFIYQKTGLSNYLTLEGIKANQDSFNQFYSENPVLTWALFFSVYVLVTAFSFPGAAILTLASGAFFGVLSGTLIVSFASTIGATLAFLSARFLLRDSLQKKFADKLASINDGVKKEGAFYLFTLRLVPVFPFFLINLVMGLTSIRTWTYFWVSQIGMLPGTIAYVNAGTQLAKIDSLKGILSFELLVAFAIMGFIPLLSKWFISYLKQRKFLKNLKKPKKFDYNIVVIGAGSAGLVSAYIAAAVKAKVALIEKHKMGGDCLNTGCVPSKALIKSAKVFNYAKRAQEFGIEVSAPKVNFAKVMERVKNVISEIEPHDSIERYTSLGVDCMTGEAQILSPYEVKVNSKVLTTKNIVVATGARPLVPNIPGLKDEKFLTSDNLWEIRDLPEHLVVLGGGPIGCELAQSFSRFGSKVTMVEMAPRIMAREDEDVSALVTERFKGEGIQVLTQHRALQVDAQRKVLICESQGLKVEVPYDRLLLALGRQANVKGFGLEALGVEISSRGTVVANDYLQTTNYPNIYVCGDVTGPYQFTHTASHQAWFVAVNALFSPLKKFKVDYRIIPWCTFTDPEVARVGLNEIEAREKGIDFEVTRYGIDDLDRAIAEGEAHGFVKVLTPRGEDKILGVTIVGDHAGDIIAEYVAAMKHGFGLNKILSTIHIYPTLAEANKFAAGVWKKNHAPQKALEYLQKFHAWRRG